MLTRGILHETDLLCEYKYAIYNSDVVVVLLLVIIITISKTTKRNLGQSQTRLRQILLFCACQSVDVIKTARKP